MEVIHLGAGEDQEDAYARGREAAAEAARVDAEAAAEAAGDVSDGSEEYVDDWRPAGAGGSLPALPDDGSNPHGDGGTTGDVAAPPDSVVDDDDTPDVLRDAIVAAQAAEKEQRARQARAHNRQKRREARQRAREREEARQAFIAGEADASVLAEPGAGAADDAMRTTAQLRVKELYPAVEKELYSPDYWKHWNTEAVASRSAASLANTTLSKQKARAKAEATRGMKGVKLETQWVLDHPFRRGNRFGIGARQSAFLDTESEKCPHPQKDYLSEFRMPLQKPPLPSGGVLSSTGRDDLARAMPTSDAAGPGAYRIPGSIGRQVLSIHRSAPAIGISASDAVNHFKTDSPGPKYLPKYSVRIHGNKPSIIFPTAERDRRVIPDSPGPKYNLGGTLGKGGPAFTFSVSGDSRHSKEAYLTKPKKEAETPTEAPSGFGYGCNVEEHIKYGHCLDGRCSIRSNWEGIRKRYADGHTRMLKTMRREVKLAQQEAERAAAEAAEAIDGMDAPRAASAPPGTTGSAADTASVGGSTLDTAMGSTRGSTRRRGGGKGKKRKKKARGHRAANLRPDGAPRDSHWMPVKWWPPDDVFSPFCEACGSRVNIMTRHERILATNRALNKHATEFVSGLVTAGPKKGKFLAGGLQSARSVQSLNSITSNVSGATFGSLASRRSRGSSSRRGAGTPRARSVRSGMSRSSVGLRPGASALSSGARSTSGETGHSAVSKLSHRPDSVEFLPGCGFFCDKKCIRQFVVANVGNGSANDPVKSKKNVKRTALLLCVKQNNLEQLSFLLRNGSRIDLLAELRRSVLHIAAEEGLVRIMDRLFCGAFNVLAYQVCKRHHPAECACYNQRLDPNTRDMDGSTPLHIAAAKGRKLCLMRLLSVGADPELLDFEGQAPHDVASTQECYSLLKNAVAVADTADHLRSMTLRQYDLMRQSGKIAHTETPHVYNTGIGPKAALRASGQIGTHPGAPRITSPGYGPGSRGGAASTATPTARTLYSASSGHR